MIKSKYLNKFQFIFVFRFFVHVFVYSNDSKQLLMQVVGVLIYSVLS